MRVNSITVENFKGIKGLTYSFQKPITVLTGSNGCGKTSFMQAFRYGLTNETPSQAVTSGETESHVILGCKDDIVIERTLSRPNKKATKLMGRATGTKASETFLEEEMELPSEVMKIATSSEVLAGMKPSQFGSIFLNESMEKKSLDDLLGIFKTCDTKERKAIMKEGEEELPADVLSEIKSLFVGKDFNMEAITKAFEEAKSIRRDRNSQYKISSAKSKGFEEIVKPEYTEAELNKRYEELVGIEKNVSAYYAQVEAYKKALENKKAQDLRISELEMALLMVSAEKPNPADLAELQKKRREMNLEIVNQSKVEQTLSDNKKWFERTLEQLGKPVCPISNKLICSTDKTSLKSELEEKVQEIDRSIALVQSKIAEYRKMVAETDEKIVVYNQNKEKWAKKEMQERELASIRKRAVVLPEEPEKLVLKKNYSKEKRELKDQMETLRQYHEAEKEYKNTLTLRRSCKVSDFIVKSLDPKGPVIKEFISKFADLLEEACNERANVLKSDFSVHFIAEDGLKVLFRSAKGKPFLPYENLSAGEKILASVVLTDLINSFYGSRVLILDNTDQLDRDAFACLMNFMETSAVDELYDNILISCVSHPDLLEVLDNLKKSGACNFEVFSLS